MPPPLVPQSLTGEVNFAGPFVTWTLCGALPRHTQRTVVPLDTVMLLGLNRLSLIDTVLVPAPDDGTARTPAARAAAAPAANSFFMGLDSLFGMGGDLKV